MPTRWPITNADQVEAYVALTQASCPRCRYSLQGLRSPVCPECGTELTVQALARPRGWTAVCDFFAAEDPGPRPFRVMAGINVLLALAIMVSSVANHGHLPLLSWLAPGVLGAFVFSIQYLAVFARYCPVRYDPIEGLSEGVVAPLALVQGAGLILMWV